MHIPNKFADLVEIAENKYPKPAIVESNEEMWSHFCRAALLGGERNRADMNYLYHLLDEEGLLYRESLEDEWIKYTSEFLRDAKDEIDPDQPNVKGKFKAIQKLEAELHNIYMLLRNGDDIFKKQGIDAKFLQTIAGNHEEEKSIFVKFATNNENAIVKKTIRLRNPERIWGLTYNKAIFWLQNCGVALDFIPNDELSLKFLREYDNKWDSTDFFEVNKKFNEFCERISVDAYYAGLALWHYESTKNLMTRKSARYYSPLKLMKIMENNDMDIEDVRVCLEDIENWEYVREVFKENPVF
jgi:hypothetical protein